MIFYFTGTGNSRFVAEQIAKKTNDELISMNDLFRNGANREYKSEKPFVFVCPIFAWNIPKIVKSFFEKVNLLGNEKVYFLTTCGGTSGAANKNIEKLVKSKNLVLQGFDEIIMPDNYIMLYNPSSKSQGVETIKKSLPKIDELAKKINECENFSLGRSSSVGNSINSSKIMGTVFDSLIVKDKKFYTTEKCTGCGKCAEVCPIANINIMNNKPNWNGNCIHCVACISVCPHRAIEYGNKTQERNRYYLPSNSEF